MRGAPRALALVWALSAIVVLSPMAAALGGGLATGTSGPSGGAAPGATDRAVAPTLTSAAVGSVLATLDLFNETTFPGYSPAAADWYPDSVVYDPLNLTAWVGGGASGLVGVEVVSPTTGLGVRVLPGGVASAVAYDNLTNTMWVTGGTSGTTNYVTVYNASTYVPLATVGTGAEPDALVYDNETNDVYVVNFESENVSVVGGTNDTDFASVPVGDAPTDIAYDAQNGQLYVSNQATSNLTSFSQSGPVDSFSIAVSQPGHPYGLLYDPENEILYVNDLAPGLAIINTTTNTDVGSIAVPGAASMSDGMAIDPTNDSLRVASYAQGELLEYAPAPSHSVTSAQDTSTMGPIGEEAGMSGVAYDTNLTRFLAVDSNPTSDASTNLTEICICNNSVFGGPALENLPLGIAVSARHSAIYVYDGNTGTLDVVNEVTDALARSVHIGYTGTNVAWESGSVAYDPVNDTIYVDFEQDYGIDFGVAVVNASTFAVAYLPSEYFADPAGLLYDTADQTLLVADSASGQVGVVTPGAPGAPVNISVGPNPVGLALDPTNDQVYVTNSANNTVAAIDVATDAVVRWIPVGDEPVGIVYDPSTQDLYVANSYDRTLSVISASEDAAEGEIALGGTLHPLFVAYDPLNETLLVTEPGALADSSVSDLAFVNASNRTYFGSASFGQALSDLVWDSDTGTAFVSGTIPGAVYEFGWPPETPPSSLSVALTATPSTVQTNETTTLSASVRGGTGVLTYAYSTLPPGCATADTAVLACTPTVAGTYFVGVNVTQAGGPSGSAVAELTVVARAGPLSVTLSADPATLMIGGTTLLTASAAGGSPPLSYAYSTLPAGCSSANESSLACRPTATGTFVVGVNVTDSAGTTAAATASLIVTAPLSATLTAVPAAILLGSSSTLQVTVSGGYSGSLTYVYSGLPSGCVGADAAQIVCAPASAGTYFPQVVVNDSAGHVASASTTLTVSVVTSTAPSNSGAGAWPWIVVGLIVLAGVLAVLIFVQYSKRTRAN